MAEFFRNLKEARQEAGLTQKDLAEKIGVAKSTYSLYESGKREPGVQTIKIIAETLNVSADVLLDIHLTASATTVLVDKYRRLDIVDQAKVEERIDTLLDSEKYKKESESEKRIS